MHFDNKMYRKLIDVFKTIWEALIKLPYLYIETS